jgi:hypothetical protein
LLIDAGKARQNSEWVTNPARPKYGHHQIGSNVLTGRNEPGMATYDIPNFGRPMSALANTLDLAQKIVAKTNIVAAIAKLAFLRM